MSNDGTACLTDNAFCLSCGYSLRQLTANRCPECGKPFDPADPRTMSKMLLDYGLTGPEAEGLIGSWAPQFFHAEGRRFVLRMSPADYAEQCPMSIRPAPTAVVRLGLVLTEFEDDKVTK